MAFGPESMEIGGDPGTQLNEGSHRLPEESAQGPQSGACLPTAGAAHIFADPRASGQQRKTLKAKGGFSQHIWSPLDVLQPDITLRMFSPGTSVCSSVRQSWPILSQSSALPRPGRTCERWSKEVRR